MTLMLEAKQCVDRPGLFDVSYEGAIWSRAHIRLQTLVEF
jgi:hypothetical protein